jgi:hypothetical protein
MKIFKRFKLKRGKEELNSTGGNYVCGQMISEEAFEQVPENFQPRRKDSISDRNVLMTMIGMLCNSRTDFNDVKLYQEDIVFAHSFQIDKLPSEATLRQRLDELPEQRSHVALRGFNQALLKGRTFGTVQAGHLNLVPVDIDVSVLDNSDSNKQGVSFTYKKHDGFAPIFAYIGKEGYMLNHELRPGSQNCQNQTPEFIADCMGIVDSLGLNEQTLLRLDSGNDAAENFAHFGKSYFIVKRNLRKESREQWLAMARRVGQLQSTREGKNVYTGFVDHLRPGGRDSKLEPVPAAFEVIERLTDYDGNYLLKPEIEVNTFWTNVPCEHGKEIIDLYHDHGTCEQFHSELKTDLNIERLPSSKFAVNKIVLLCGMIAFNLLRCIGQEVIERAELAPVKIKVQRWRLKTVLQNIIYCAVRIIRHGREIKLHFGKYCPWFDVINDMARAKA